MAFQKADKRQGHLRVALTAPSGGGKTFSALLIATGIVEEMKKKGMDTGKGIAVIDTENGSALDYADRYEFDHLKIEPPYTTPKYIAAMQEAYGAGYAVLIVDSLSHAWAGEGGLLQKKEAIDARGGNSYTNWATITKEHEQLKAIILSNKIHLICAMRSKQDYIIEQNDKGKSAPRKVGLAPVQREGMEYEFTVVFDLGMDHSAHVSKDRTALFDGEVFKPTKKTGAQLLDWRMSGKPEEPEAPPAAAEQPPATPPAPPVTPPPAAKPPTPAPIKTGVFTPTAMTNAPSKKDAKVTVWQPVLQPEEGTGVVLMRTDKQDHANVLDVAIKDKAKVQITYKVFEAACVIQTVDIVEGVLE